MLPVSHLWHSLLYQNSIHTQVVNCLIGTKIVAILRSSNAKIAKYLYEILSYNTILIPFIGVKNQISNDLPSFIEKVRKHVNTPLAVGFGISTKEHFDRVAKLGEGVVVGSMLTKKIGESEIGTRADIAKEVAQYFSAPVQATPDEERAAHSTEVERSK